MQIYHYSKVTGELTNETVARLDPIGNMPMVPANATLIEPPESTEGHALVFEGGAWTIKQDHRGDKHWSTETTQPLVITTLGDLPENSTPLDPAGVAFPTWGGELGWVVDETLQAEARKNEIYAELTALDTAAVRPLLATVNGTAVDFDREKIATLAADAETLREELRGL